MALKLTATAPGYAAKLKALNLKADDPNLQTTLQERFMAVATAAKFNPNWALLIAWAEKYAPDFWSAVMDVITGNWAALWAIAAAQGIQCVIDLLAALGITLAPAPATP
jgi:hypothetical protein